MTQAEHTLLAHVKAGSIDTTTNEQGCCNVCGAPTGEPSLEYWWKQWAYQLAEKLQDWHNAMPEGTTSLCIRVSQATAVLIAHNLAGPGQGRYIAGQSAIWGIPLVIDPCITQLGAVEVCYRDQLPELPRG